MVMKRPHEKMNKEMERSFYYSVDIVHISKLKETYFTYKHISDEIQKNAMTLI